MNRQVTLDNFFNKSKASTSKCSLSSFENFKTGDDGMKTLKRNLSLKKTPVNSPEMSNVTMNNQEIISLLSDDDDIWVTPPKKKSQESETDSSTSTILYSLSPGTPQKTPVKTSLTSTPFLIQTQNSQSPSKREKFFSPTKKRSVIMRSPVTVKRNLNTEFTSQSTCDGKGTFSATFEGLDDKTIFLLTIIDKCLNDPTLRPLLDCHSETLLTKCLQVVKPGMRLVCRLYWRKEGWYKREQVVQICNEGKEPPDDQTLQSMLKSLVDNGLIIQGDSSNLTFDDFKIILKGDEWKQICKELKMKIQSKQEAIEALANFSRRTSNISNFITGCTSNNARRVLQIMSSKAGPCYKLSDVARTAIYKLYVLMYLGIDYNVIREKKLELILIYDKINRETYPVDKEMAVDNASVVFRNKDEFERYTTAHCIFEDFLTKTEVIDKCRMLKQVYNLYKDIDQRDMKWYNALPQWLRRYTPPHVYIKILEAGIQDLKRDKDGGHYLLALDILTSLVAQTAFRQHKKAEWYAEKALIYSNLHRFEEAATVLLEGFQADLSEEAKDSMRPRAMKLARQKNITLSNHLKEKLFEYGTKERILEKNIGGKHVYKQPLEQTGKRGKVKFETRTAEGRMVQEAEECCITHYICSGEFTDGEHWEGRIITTIFFLLFWDIIYSKPPDVTGVFLTHYQQFPLDLLSEDFYTNRKAEIDNWLGVIERATEMKLVKIMYDIWTKRPEHEVSGVSRSLGWDNIEAVTSCLGPRGVAALCRRLAANYRYAHSGFPDLTLWNRHTKQIKFVEVKTDSDKPSMKQIQWMSYLREHDIDTEFCYLGANTKRQKCRIDKLPQTPKKEQNTKTRNKGGRKGKTEVKIESVTTDERSEFKTEAEIKEELKTEF